MPCAPGRQPQDADRARWIAVVALFNAPGGFWPVEDGPPLGVHVDELDTGQLALVRPSKGGDNGPGHLAPVALRQQLDELADGSFVERGINVLAFGLPGTGKTHAMCAIGHRLVESGRSALFMNVGGRVLTNGELEHHQNTDKRVKKTESHIEQGRIPRRTDRIRRGQRRNLKPKPPRSKNWTLEQYGDLGATRPPASRADHAH